MSVKEKPLIDAVEKLGALPGFFFEHPIIAGAFAIVMCPVFGAVFVLFQTAGYGGVDALQLYEAARVGGYVTLIFGAIILLVAALGLFEEIGEKSYRRQFLVGGALGFVFLIGMDLLTVDWLRAYFAEAGPLMCTSQSPACP